MSTAAAVISLAWAITLYVWVIQPKVFLVTELSTLAAVSNFREVHFAFGQKLLFTLNERRYLSPKFIKEYFALSFTHKASYIIYCLRVANFAPQFNCWFGYIGLSFV